MHFVESRTHRAAQLTVPHTVLLIWQGRIPHPAIHGSKRVLGRGKSSAYIGCLYSIA